MFSYIEADDPKDLARTLNEMKGAKVVGAFNRGARCGVLVDSPEAVPAHVSVERGRPRAAIEHEKKVAAEARDKAKAEAKAEKAAPKPKAAKDEAKPSEGSDAPGPVVEA